MVSVYDDDEILIEFFQKIRMLLLLFRRGKWYNYLIKHETQDR